jgi:hypothetical protein
MRVRFLRDFRGVNTGEAFYRAGEEADLDTWAALAEEGAVALVDEPAAAEPPAEPAPAPRLARRERGGR